MPARLIVGLGGDGFGVTFLAATTFGAVFFGCGFFASAFGDPNSDPRLSVGLGVEPLSPFFAGGDFGGDGLVARCGAIFACCSSHARALALNSSAASSCICLCFSAAAAAASAAAFAFF